MIAHPTAVELNRRNKAFWRAQKIEMIRRMADETVRECAFDVLQSELHRGLPAYYQTPLEVALANSEHLKSRFLRHQARIGGRVSKADTLNELILEIVRRQPTVTEHDLLELLHQQQGLGKIEDVEEEAIWFTSRGGRLKSAKVTGLKDRLSRAKRRMHSR
jgi:hypothetical protein